MDIYDFKMMGHSGFEHCRIVDSAYYDGKSEEVEGVLFLGDVDDAPECLDDLEITSIDLCYNEKANRIDVTIDVDGYGEETMAELHAWREEGDGDDDDGDDDGGCADPMFAYATGQGPCPWGEDGDGDDGLPIDGSKPQLATDDLEPGQWLE